MKSYDNIRCIRKYEKKDGSITLHAEVRRKNAKPLRESFRTLTDAKNWVRKEDAIYFSSFSWGFFLSITDFL
jgi:hypothetical protein